MAGGGGRNWRLVRADTDAVPSSVRRFMARARQRRLRAALPWAVGTGVLLVIALLGWMVFGTSLLGVRLVRVEGVDVLTPLQVQQAAAVPEFKPLARVDLGTVRRKVEALPPVDRVVVSRSWPATLVIRVIERTPVAAVPAGTDFQLVDRHGVAYRVVGERPPGLPVAKLATPPAAGDLNTKAALTVLAALTPDLRAQLTAITVDAPARIRLALRGGRTVIWGDDTASGTKAQVATALLRRQGDTIDVSAPDVVTIR